MTPPIAVPEVGTDRTERTEQTDRTAHALRLRRERVEMELRSRVGMVVFYVQACMAASGTPREAINDQRGRDEVNELVAFVLREIEQ